MTRLSGRVVTCAVSLALLVASWLGPGHAAAAPTGPPPLAWARGMGGSGNDGASAVAVDASGAVTLIGSLSESATFGSGAEAVTLAAAGWGDVFVARYHSDGTLAWATSATGPGSDGGSGVAVDATGSATVVGTFNGAAMATGIVAGAATFGTGPEAVTLTASYDDVFVARHNADGSLAWAQRAGGDGADFGAGVAVDASGAATVTGSYWGPATFGVGTAAVTLPSTRHDAFVARYHANGTLEWVRGVGGPGSDVGSGVAVDATGVTTVTGSFTGSATFGSGADSVTLTAAGRTDEFPYGAFDVFVARYDADGTLAWAERAGGTESDDGIDVALDVTGAATVTGNFRGTATFGSGAQAVTLTSAGWDDVFVARYDADGTLDWARKAGGPNGERVSAVAVDATGASTVTGEFTGTSAFGGAEAVTSAPDFPDMFVARYDADGTLVWVASAGGPSADRGSGVAVDATGAATVAGHFWGSLTFGSGAEGVTLTSEGGDDLFVARYGGTPRVDRVWGETAVGTAAALSRDAFPSGAPTAYVATLSGYWDALSGGAAAARQGGPMLLTETDALPLETREELARLRPATIVVQGGVLAVSSAVEAALRAYAPTVVRNAGDTAIGTAVLTSERAFPAGARSVFVATAASFHDALSGGAAAGGIGAPVLLVDPTLPVDPRVTGEIRRLGADRVYLLGGPLALPEAIQTQLAAIGVPVQRLWGESELDTSLAINRATMASPEQVYLVTSQAYYDGLAAAPAAARARGAVLLTDGQCLQQEMKTYLRSLSPSRVTVVGGTLAMAPALDTLVACER